MIKICFYDILRKSLAWHIITTTINNSDNNSNNKWVRKDYVTTGVLFFIKYVRYACATVRSSSYEWMKKFEKSNEWKGKKYWRNEKVENGHARWSQSKRTINHHRAILFKWNSLLRFFFPSYLPPLPWLLFSFSAPILLFFSLPLSLSLSLTLIFHLHLSFANYRLFFLRTVTIRFRMNISILC